MPPLTNEQLCPLARQRSKDAMELLVRSNLPFLHRTANHLTCGQSPHHDDLVQEGALGLLEAARRFDPDRGLKFLSYAAPAVRNAMTDFLRTQGNRGEAAPLSWEELHTGPIAPSPEVELLRQEQQEDFLHLFRSAAAPDAVCCYNDCAALKLLQLLRQNQIDHSKVRFAGYDNLSLLRYFPQKLFTAALPLAELGREAAEILLRRIENRSFKPVCKRLSAEILER